MLKIMDGHSLLSQANGHEAGPGPQWTVALPNYMPWRIILFSYVKCPSNA